MPPAWWIWWGCMPLMGLGLNIVVGFAGLLDLGYVAFFAIGAYTMGVLTSGDLGPAPGRSLLGRSAHSVGASVAGPASFWLVLVRC